MQLTWLSPQNDISTYLHMVHINCLVVEATIKQIETSSKKISSICFKISNSFLIILEKKRIYEISEFDDIQAKHRSTMREEYERAYNSLKENLAISYEKCSSNMEDVHIAWNEYHGRVCL